VPDLDEDSTALDHAAVDQVAIRDKLGVELGSLVTDGEARFFPKPVALGTSGRELQTTPRLLLHSPALATLSLLLRQTLFQHSVPLLLLLLLLCNALHKQVLEVLVSVLGQGDSGPGVHPARS